MSRNVYPSDVSDIEWLILLPLIPTAKTGGRPRSVDIREIVNAIFSIQNRANLLRHPLRGCFKRDIFLQK